MLSGYCINKQHNFILPYSGMNMLYRTLHYLLLCCSTFLFAQTHPEQLIQDVFQSELVYPQESGELQFTISPNLQNSRPVNLLSSPVAIEYGLSDSWQIEFSWMGYVHQENSLSGNISGPGDVEIGTKWRFLSPGHRNIQSAVGLDLQLPTGGTDGINEDDPAVEPYVIAAMDLNWLNDAHIFTQVGGEISLTSETDDAPGIFMNSGIIYPFRTFCVSTELNWITADEIAEIYVTPGIISTYGSYEFGFAIPIGVSSPADTYRIIAQFSIEFSLNGDETPD
ncbi:MAG: hypothetical protein H6629_17745 [Calditrichae bacterium]|nr:hypothetical protein [Calditrichia bacterium]